MARLLLVLLFLFQPKPIPGAGDEASADARKLQGTWSVVRLEGPVTHPELLKHKFTFDKTSLSIKTTTRTMPSIPFKLTVKKGMSLIDFQQNPEAKPLRGLYQFTRSGLILSLGRRPGDPRPVKFGDPRAMTLFLKKDGK